MIKNALSSPNKVLFNELFTTMGQSQSSNKPKHEGDVCLDVIRSNDFWVKKSKLEEKANSKETARYPRSGWLIIVSPTATLIVFIFAKQVAQNSKLILPMDHQLNRADKITTQEFLRVNPFQ